MTTHSNPLNWKIAATVGTIAGVAIGGFAFAAPDGGEPIPDGVILQDQTASVPRLSAPVVVPTTAAQIASTATVVPPTPVPAEPVQLSAPSPVSPIVAPPAPEPAPVAVEIDSPMSPASPPPAPAEIDSPMSPPSPVSVQSPRERAEPRRHR